MYLAVLVLVFVGAASAGTVYERIAAAHDARQGALRDAQFQSSLAARNINSDLNQAQNTVAATASSPAISQVFSTPTGCTLSFAGQSAFTDGHLDIVRSDGSIACTSLRGGGVGYAASPWFVGALTAPVLVAPVIDIRTGRQTVVASAPIPGRGAVVMFLDLDTLGPTLTSSVGGPRHLEFVVTTGDGRTALSRSINPARWAGADISATRFATSASSTERPDLDGRRRLYGQTTVSGIGWRVVAGADRASALAEASRVSRREMIITLSGLLIFFVVALVISRRIALPIRRLSIAVTAATTGIRQPNISIDGPAEIANLAQDVNTLILAAQRELVAVSRLAAVVESTPDAIVGMTMDRAITSWNPGAEETFGYTAEEANGRDALMLTRATRAHEVEAIFARLARGERIPAYEVQLVRKDGSPFDAIVTISPLRDNAGRVAGAFAVCRDVTEMKRAESERGSLQEQLNQSQRLESLGQLAGGIAHDFNNLLGVILNYAGFVAEELGGNVAAQADVAQIQAAAERGARLTRQLLVVGRRESVTVQDLDLNEVVRDMYNLLSRSIGEHVLLVAEMAPSVPLVRADRGQIEQVLLNLAVNARDAMPSGGTLTITTSVADIDAEHCRVHPELQPGRFVELIVTDTGIGMTPSVAARIFEPFFTTKPRGEGSGLGLATLYGIVTGLGGSVSVASEVGAGTAFRILLPAVVSEPTSAAEPATPSGSTTVLLVEDDPAMLELTARILRRHGLAVFEAATYDEAVTLVGDHEFDVLLTDSVPPSATEVGAGPGLADTVRASRPDVAIVVMSADTDRLPPTPMVAEEGAVLIQKPFDERDLMAKIDAALAARRTRDA